MRISIVHNGVGYTEATAAELAERGVPQAVIDQALSAIRVSAIKVECRRRIYAAASAETQMNMASMAAVIGANTLANRTEPEKAALAAFEASLGWVQAMRGAVATLAAEPSADYQADAAWPACPPAVLALVSQF